MLADAPRTPTPRPSRGEPLQLPVRLMLSPLPQPVAYTATTRWEERLGKEVKRTIVTKHLTLGAAPEPAGPGIVLTLATAPPALRGPDRTPTEEVLLLLAGLYQHLVLRVSASGRVLALANEADIRRTWEEIKAALVARYGDDDPLTASLRSALDAQLYLPGSVLASLRYDYAYELLVANLYQQRFESEAGYTQPKAFPQFFAGADLHFHECLTLGMPTAPNRVTLHLRGQPDEQRIDRLAVAEQVAALLSLGAEQQPANQPAVDPAGLEFSYCATYDVDAATGWPVTVEAVVNCRYPAAKFAKEYDLTIERL